MAEGSQRKRQDEQSLKNADIYLEKMETDILESRMV